MKKNKLLITFILLLIFTTLGIFAVNSEAQSAVPGSGADPLVSRSCVDSRINQVIAMIANPQPSTGNIDADSLREEIMAEIIAKLAYTPVFAHSGQIVLGGEGTEIILRSGRGFAYTLAENGVINTTTGMELFNDFEIPRNHSIVIPRDDGRGVRVIEDAWFIVRGGFQIVSPLEGL